VLGFSDEVINVLQTYIWPGNQREMLNVIKRSALLSQGDLIQKEVLPVEIKSPTEHQVSKKKSYSRNENDRELIINGLNEVDNNKYIAAKLLNITRKTLYNKIKEYQIDA